MELTPLHLRCDIYGTGTGDGVDPQNVEHEYESRDGSRDGVDPSKLTSLWYLYGDKNLRWQYLQKCIISTSATYICHTWEKVKKKQGS